MLREKKALSDLKQLKLYVPKLMHRLHFIRFDWHHSHCEPMFTQYSRLLECCPLKSAEMEHSTKKLFYLTDLFTFKLSDFKCYTSTLRRGKEKNQFIFCRYWREREDVEAVTA